MDLIFKINDDIIKIENYEDGTDHPYKMANDDTYTVQYIIELINNGLLSLREELHTIIRISENGETLIYGLSPENLESVETTQTSTLKNGKATMHEWTDGETRQLLDLYEEHLPQVGPMKKYKSKKQMWEYIAKALNHTFSINVTHLQCENRFKTVLKRKKDAVDNNNKSGSSYMSIPFEQELGKIASIDDSIEPEVMGTAEGITVKKVAEKKNKNEASTSFSEQPDAKRIKPKTMQETLLEIHQMKEEARERRHREKMEYLKSICEK